MSERFIVISEERFELYSRELKAALWHFVPCCDAVAAKLSFSAKSKTPPEWAAFLSMGYKKDTFGIFAYEFELLPKYPEFSNLVCGGGEPPSVDQWLHHFETAYKNHRDLFLGITLYYVFIKFLSFDKFPKRQERKD